MSTEVENNLEKIKQQVKEGVTTSSNSLADTSEIVKVHKEFLALKSIEGVAQKNIYELKLNEFNSNLNKLAKHLNTPFVNEHTTNRVLECIQFDEYLEEKLTTEEYNIYNTQLKNKFSFEQLKESLGGKTCNAYHSLATLNGFDNIVDYTKAQEEKQAMFEEEAKKGQEKQERIDEMKQAYKEALKEHKEGV